MFDKSPLLSEDILQPLPEVPPAYQDLAPEETEDDEQNENAKPKID